MRLAVCCLVVIPTVLGAQRGLATRADSGSAPSACWRFAFGEWTPPLDWSKAGHAGDSAGVAARVQRARDSVYDNDSAGARRNAMTIEYTKQGMLVVLYPPWWPAGVSLTFDSTLAGGREMAGTAVALVADGTRASPHTRAHAQQTACPGRAPSRVDWMHAASIR